MPYWEQHEFVWLSYKRYGTHSGLLPIRISGLRENSRYWELPRFACIARLESGTWSQLLLIRRVLFFGPREHSPCRAGVESTASAPYLASRRGRTPKTSSTAHAHRGGSDPRKGVLRDCLPPQAPPLHTATAVRALRVVRDCLPSRCLFTSLPCGVMRDCLPSKASRLT